MHHIKYWYYSPSTMSQENKNEQKQDGKKYFEQAAKVLKRVNEIRTDKSQDWQEVVGSDGKGGAELYKKDYPDICPTPCYLTRATFKQPLAKMVARIWDMTEAKAKVNDPKLTMWTEVEKGENWKVCSQHNTMGWPVWPRHTVFAQVRFDEPGKTQLVAFSVNHKKAPVDESTHVRAHVHLSVYTFVDNKNGTTTVSRMTQVDPRGDVPTWIVNMYAKNQVNMFNQWQ
jgi:hypothetical protein